MCALSHPWSEAVQTIGHYSATLSVCWEHYVLTVLLQVLSFGINHVRPATACSTRGVARRPSWSRHPVSPLFPWTPIRWIYLLHTSNPTLCPQRLTIVSTQKSRWANSWAILRRQVLNLMCWMRVPVWLWNVMRVFSSRWQSRHFMASLRDFHCPRCRRQPCHPCVQQHPVLDGAGQTHIQYSISIVFPCSYVISVH